LLQREQALICAAPALERSKLLFHGVGRQLIRKLASRKRFGFHVVDLGCHAFEGIGDTALFHRGHRLVHALLGFSAVLAREQGVLLALELLEPIVHVAQRRLELLDPCFMATPRGVHLFCCLTVLGLTGERLRSEIIAALIDREHRSALPLLRLLGLAIELSEQLLLVRDRVGHVVLTQVKTLAQREDQAKPEDQAKLAVNGLPETTDYLAVVNEMSEKEETARHAPVDFHQLVRQANVAEIRSSAGRPGLEQLDADGYTPLMAAIQAEQDAIAQALVELGADHHATTKQGDTPLSLAAEKGLPLTTVALLARGAAVDARNNKGHTPLMMAASKGKLEPARLLIRAGARLDSTCVEKAAVLSHAASTPAGLGVMRLLLDEHAELEQRDASGRTPLMYAAGNGRESQVRLLLKHGADPLARNNSGNTALDFAYVDGNPNALQNGTVLHDAVEERKKKQ